MVTDEAGVLVGIFTDSDLARLLEGNRDAAIDGPLGDIMTRAPATIAAGELLTAACDALSRRKISELPVVDQDGHPGSAQLRSGGYYRRPTSSGWY